MKDWKYFLEEFLKNTTKQDTVYLILEVFLMIKAKCLVLGIIIFTDTRDLISLIYFMELILFLGGGI